MSALILGLLMFLGMHSARIFAEGWRTQVIAQRGPGAVKQRFTGTSARRGWDRFQEPWPADIRG